MPTEPTGEQLAARLNPSPVTTPMPGEGTVFRATGDNMQSTLYTIKNGSLQSIAAPAYTANTDLRAPDGTIIKAGQAAPGNRLDGYTVINPGYNGTWVSPTPAGAIYDQQKGAGSYNALPTFNVADIQSAIDKGTFRPGTSPTINNTPNVLGNPADGKVNPDATPGAHTISSNLPGSSATTLFNYYAAKGTTLPSVQDRAAQFATLGLGSADDYTGSAQQNEELLSAMQRSDYYHTTFGSNAPGTPGSTASGTAATNNTPAGVSLAAALSGGDATSTLANYKTYLTSALGVASANVNTAETNLNSFFSTQKSADQILADAMTAAGITTKQSLVSDLTTEINKQQKLLDDLPDNLKSTLADVGVSQAQLERLTLKESQKPDALLKDLLTQRNAAQTEIDHATAFAEKFADTQVSAQAARLAALEWQVTSAKGDYKDLDADMKSVITSSINDQKGILTTALTAAKNGASPDEIQQILNSGSEAEAIAAAGHTLVTPKSTAATTAITKDLAQIGGTFTTGGNGYNGRGADGFVDPYLYQQSYNYAESTYGAAGVQAFIAKYPPAKNINPAALGQGILSPQVENAVKAGAKKSGTIS